MNIALKPEEEPPETLPEEIEHYFVFNMPILLQWTNTDAGDGETIEYKSKVCHVLHDRIALSLPPEENIAQVMSNKTKLTLLVRYNRELLPLDVPILHYEAKHPHQCWIEVTEDLLRFLKNLRRHFRVSARIPVTLEHGDNKFSSVTMNISAGGMRLLLSQNLEPGTFVQIGFATQPKSPPIQLKAEVLDCFTMKQFVAHYLVIVKFVDLPQRTEDMIVSLCFRKELEQKKHLKR